jgi:hypothetical protein
MYPKGNNSLKVLSLYTGNYESKFYLRQISTLTNLPLKTSQNALKYLEKIKILKGKIEGKNKYFTLNLENIQTKSYLLQAEIYKTDIFLDSYPLFKPFLKEIDTNIPLIVFGSFAKFKADKNSDIDLLVISDKDSRLPFHLLPYKVHQISLSEGTFLKSFESGETLIREIESAHVILNNHSFYINFIWRSYGK